MIVAMNNKAHQQYLEREAEKKRVEEARKKEKLLRERNPGVMQARPLQQSSSLTA